MMTWLNQLLVIYLHTSCDLIFSFPKLPKVGGTHSLGLFAMWWFLLHGLMHVCMYVWSFLSHDGGVIVVEMHYSIPPSYFIHLIPFWHVHKIRSFFFIYMDSTWKFILLLTFNQFIYEKIIHDLLFSLR